MMSYNGSFNTTQILQDGHIHIHIVYDKVKSHFEACIKKLEDISKRLQHSGFASCHQPHY